MTGAILSTLPYGRKNFLTSLIISSSSAQGFTFARRMKSLEPASLRALIGIILVPFTMCSSFWTLSLLSAVVEYSSTQLLVGRYVRPLMSECWLAYSSNAVWFTGVSSRSNQKEKGASVTGGSLKSRSPSVTSQYVADIGDISVMVSSIGSLLLPL